MQINDEPVITVMNDQYNNEPPSHYSSFLYYFLCTALGITYLCG